MVEVFPSHLQDFWLQIIVGEGIPLWQFGGLHVCVGSNNPEIELLCYLFSSSLDSVLPVLRRSLYNAF